MDGPLPGKGAPLCLKHELVISLSFDERSNSAVFVFSEPVAGNAFEVLTEGLCAPSRMPSAIADSLRAWLSQRTGE